SGAGARPARCVPRRRPRGAALALELDQPAVVCFELCGPLSRCTGRRLGTKSTKRTKCTKSTKKSTRHACLAVFAAARSAAPFVLFFVILVFFVFLVSGRQP